MKLNPYVNALLAGAYIVVGVFVMSTLTGDMSGPDTILAPMVFLSLFVLSAAVMGFLFVYEPARLLLDGQKKESATFLIKTIGAFAVIVLVLLVVMFFTAKQ